MVVSFMGKILFGDGSESEVADGEHIKDVCEDAGVPFACEEGICGTCVIEVVDGADNLSSFTEQELDFLGDEENERLACQCRLIKGSVKVNF